LLERGQGIGSKYEAPLNLSRGLKACYKTCFGRDRMNIGNLKWDEIWADPEQRKWLFVGGAVLLFCCIWAWSALGSKGGGSARMPAVCAGKGPHPYTSVDGARSGNYRINLYSPDGQALSQLISRGNFVVTSYHDNGGYCFGEINVQGQTNGNSYNAFIYSQLF
jgi:hypothetical protein